VPRSSLALPTDIPAQRPARPTRWNGWQPLIGNPIVRRTWAVWRANSRRRDLAVLVARYST